MYYKFSEDVKIIEEETEVKSDITRPTNNPKGKQIATKINFKNLIDLDNLVTESVDMYKMLAKRTPFSFKMFKNSDSKIGEETVCELPLLFFWIRKPPNTIYSKNTNTIGIKTLIENFTK